MVVAVLTIGVLNLAVGFALAILLEQPRVVSWPVIRIPLWRTTFRRATKKHHGRDPTAPVATDSSLRVPDGEPTTGAEPSTPTTSALSEPAWDGIPESWVARLQLEQLAPGSFAEGVLWYIHRSLPECRQQLAGVIERYHDAASAPPTMEALQEPAYAWLEQASEWASTLANPTQTMLHNELCDDLQSVLKEQLTKIRPAVKVYEQANDPSDISLDRKELLRPLSELVETTNVVRDQVEEILCRTLQQDQRLTGIADGFQLEEESELFNRIGLARVAEEWLQKDPARVRFVCGVLLDIDNLSEINDRLGESNASLLIISFGKLLKSLIRNERGFDRAARIAGQRFLLFFGDTALRNAMHGAERIRLNIQATSFKVGQETVRLTVSSAVSEWNSDETFEEWLYRMQLLLTEAKDSGRNCTCVGEDGGPRVIAPTNYSTPLREVVVEA